MPIFWQLNGIKHYSLHEVIIAIIIRVSKLQSDKFSFKSVTFYQVSEDEAGQRIDNFLISKAKNIPKSRIYRLLRKGEVRVNKKRIKPEYKLQAGDDLRLPPIKDVKVKDESQFKPVGTFPILYEDEGFLVINKPSGIAVHGGSGISQGVIESLRAIYPEYPHLELAHRLDKETSGVLLCSKKRKALVAFHQTLQQKTAKKNYMALLTGKWVSHKPIRVVDAPLRKRQLVSGERMVSVHPEGQAAKTTFKLLKNYDNACLVAAFPETGRTHQIRVHAKHLGHAILGDEKYADKLDNKKIKAYQLNRLFLHASTLAFTIENHKFSFEAPLPEDLTKVLDNLKDREIR